ncbi:hypothetical protein [Myxosarcina sp. GI1]|uniref:hypothetical protein n=1 Tax=Myxosarcina sp. GI1 TaxID=1541065 RepID=UPI0005621EDD|nr:hypothetical protein [Myxosarcina sp. GI1]
MNISKKVFLTTCLITTTSLAKFAAASTTSSQTASNIFPRLKSTQNSAQKSLGVAFVQARIAAASDGDGEMNNALEAELN